MKDEIKEILEGMKVVIKHEGSLEFDTKELKVLLDYITNLQAIEQEHQRINGELREENKRLREQLEVKNDRILRSKQHWLSDRLQ